MSIDPAPSKDKPVYLGLDIGGSFIKYGLINDRGQILFAARAVTDLTGGPQSLLRVLRLSITAMLAYCRAHKLFPRAIGFGSPGTVDAHRGIVTGESPNLRGWVKVKLADSFRKFGLPCAVDNDANCSAFAEYKFGAAVGAENVIAVTLGSGIGSGIVIDGRLFHGAFHAGAELGHVSIRADGPRCGCGNRGCLELYASANAILRRAQHLALFYPQSRLADIDFAANGDEPLAAVFRATKTGDRAAGELLTGVLDDLAVGLTGMINSFDPEVLVLGGGVIDAAPQLVQTITQKMKELIFKSSTRRLSIRRARLGNQAGFVGAAALGRELDARESGET